MEAILCARLSENKIFTKKNEGTTLDPTYSGAGKPQGGNPPWSPSFHSDSRSLNKKIMCFVMNIGN